VKLDILFRCKHCGLETPTTCDLPEDIPDDQVVRFRTTCFHCGKRCKREMKAGYARKGGGEK
jgi:transcription elongation factor Elf1